MDRTGRRPSTACAAPWGCSSWKGFTLPFRCSRRFWRMRISGPDDSIPISSSDSCRARGSQAVSSPYRSYVLVSREQIARNYRSVRAVVGAGVEVACVVKADAYGHGALEVARGLATEGARWLAGSTAGKGVALRRGGMEGTRILVMG